MNAITAPSASLPKLRKLLGPKFGYRVNPKAPTAEEREEARAQRQASYDAAQEATKRLDADRRALLAGDQEYQRLSAASKAAKEHAAELASQSRSYKITAGVCSGMFFHIRAEGDTWAEIVAKLEGRQP